MKKLFLALMAVAAIAMTVCIGCEKKPINEPEAPENERRDPTKIGDTTPQYIEGLKFNAPLRFPGAE